MVTKRPYNWSPGLILDAFCITFPARPVGMGLGAKFGRKPAKIQNQNNDFVFPILNEGKIALAEATPPPNKKNKKTKK